MSSCRFIFRVFSVCQILYVTSINFPAPLPPLSAYTPHPSSVYRARNKYIYIYFYLFYYFFHLYLFIYIYYHLFFLFLQ